MFGQAPLAAFLIAYALCRGSAQGRLSARERGVLTTTVILASSTLLLARDAASAPASWVAYGLIAVAALPLVVAPPPTLAGRALDLSVRAIAPTVASYLVYALVRPVGPVPVLIMITGVLAVAGGGAWMVTRRWPLTDHSATGRAPDMDAVEDDPRPQWIRILECLEGSCSGPDAASPDWAWTQKAIAERIGIAPARVSEFPRAFNEAAERRLAEYVPEWGNGTSGQAAPVLVERHRGAIPGESGVWTYYRLTPAGEALRAAVSAHHPEPLFATHAE